MCEEYQRLARETRGKKFELTMREELFVVIATLAIFFSTWSSVVELLLL
jgi:hypothetical protein